MVPLMFLTIVTVVCKGEQEVAAPCPSLLKQLPNSFDDMYVSSCLPQE